MSITRRMRIGGSAILLLLAAYIGITLYSSAGSTSGEDMMNIYFFNPATNELVSEEHYVPPGSYNEIAEYLWGLLILGPDNVNLSKIFPSGIDYSCVEELRVVRFIDEDAGTRNIELRLTSEYLNADPVQEIIFRTAFVRTFTELNWVNEVYFKINGAELLRLDGTPVGPMRRDNVLISPQITQEKRTRKMVYLYFPNEEQTGLVAERRVIEVPSNVAEEKVVLQALFDGPNTEGLVSLIPYETSINDINTEDMTCYVDLSPAFDSRLLTGTSARRLTVYSIVNTLTGLSTTKGDINKVQFLINAERVPNKNYEIDLSQTFERNENLILDLLESDVS